MRYGTLLLLSSILTEIQSLESFIRDYSSTVKSVLEKYTDNMTLVSLPLVAGITLTRS